MSNIRNLIEAAQSQSDSDTLAADILQIVKGELPNSRVTAQYKRGLGNGAIFVEFGIIGDTKELSNGIKQNDPLNTTFSIVGMEDFGDITASLTVDAIQGTRLSTTPPEGSHLAFTQVKTGWRKKTGTPQQIVKHLKTYFARLHKVVRDNEANVYRRSQYNDKYFK